MAKKTAFEAPRSNMYMLLPEELTVVDDPKHWLYDPRVATPPDEAFIADIETRGIIQPINVVKEDDKTLVVTGRRRVRAAQTINARRKGQEPIRVPCWQRKGDEADLYAVAVAENTHRRNDSIAETVAKATQLSNLTGDQKRVAAAMGKTVQQISQLLKVNELHKSVRTALYANKLGLVAALEFHGMPLPEQEAALKKLLADFVGKNGSSVTSPMADNPSPPSGAAPISKPAATRPARKHPTVSAKKVKEQLGKKTGMKSQKEIEERLATKNLPPDYRLALLWVLGQDTTQATAPQALKAPGLSLGGTK